MNWLRVTKLVVNEGVPLWDKTNIEAANRLKDFMLTNGLLSITLYQTDYGWLIIGEYPDEQTYTTLLDLLYTNPDWQAREQYYIDNSITQENVYWGPDGYSPV